MRAYLLGALISMAAIVVFCLQNNNSRGGAFYKLAFCKISLALVALIATLGGLDYIYDRQYPVIKDRAEIKRIN